MNEKGPSLAVQKKKLTRGLNVVLPGGQQGVFLEFFPKSKRASAWVLVGGLDGPKAGVAVEALCESTFGRTW